MSLFRRLPTRRLIAVIAGTLAAAGVVTAIAVAATSGGSVPPAKPLAAAVHDALTAPAVQGVTARISFTNKLLDSSSIQGAADPLLTGATGRLWTRADGHLRLELQSDAGDAQILSDGKTISLYSASANTVYKATLPQNSGQDKNKPETAPTLAAITSGLAKLGLNTDLSGAKPSNVAGRPAYTVQIGPKHDGGLLGAAQLAWDAATGTPLRVAIYAAGTADPVLELKATEINYGPVGDDAFNAAAPADAKVVDLTPQLASAAAKQGKHGDKHLRRGAVVSGPAAVQAKLPFTLSAPETLAGLPRQSVHLIMAGGTPGALVTYGKGLGGIAVLQTAAKGGASPVLPGGAKKRDGGGALPSISINGATGQELATALGTILTFTRGDVRYVVAGSVPPVAAEAAARGL